MANECDVAVPAPSSPLPRTFAGIMMSSSPLSKSASPSLPPQPAHIQQADDTRTQASRKLRVDVSARDSSPTASSTASPSPSPCPASPSTPPPPQQQQPRSRASSTSATANNSTTIAPARSNSFLASLNPNLALFAAAMSGENASSSAALAASAASTPTREITVVYETPGPLLMDLYSRADGCGAFVKSFRTSADGVMGAAQASGQVRVNDMLHAINDTVVAELEFAAIIQTAKTASFPCTLVFHSRLPAPVPASPSPSSSSSPRHSADQRTASWSSKIGQIMVENGLTRSSSFERKSSDSASSPVGGSRRRMAPRPSSATASSASVHHQSSPFPSATPPNGGEGTSKQLRTLALDKVKNSDGVKNLLRMMGGGGNTTRARPEEDAATVELWLNQLQLQRGEECHEMEAVEATRPIVALIAEDRRLGARSEDAHEWQLTWYRKTQDEAFTQIRGVRNGRYLPSVDDIGAVISLRCQSLRFPSLEKIVELGERIQVDPAVQEMVDILLEAGAGSFSATLASNEYDSFQIKITESNVTLIKISENEEEAGVVASVAYHSHLQVLVDPSDQTRFAIKVQELGSLLGHRSGDRCIVKDKKQQLDAVSCFFLVAQNPQHRGILALLIRRFRARAISSADEEVAHQDEMNLYVDPASSLNGGHAFSSFSDSTHMTGDSSSSRKPLPTTPPRSDAHSREGPPASSSSNSVAALFAHAARFTDLFDLSVDTDFSPPPHGFQGLNGSSLTPASTVTNSSAGASPHADNAAFLHDRLTAQDKEIQMLQDKSEALSVLVKATEFEKSSLKAALDTKDMRIESLQLQLRQIETANVQLTAQSRELRSVRARLEAETKAHVCCQQQLAKALEERVDPDAVDQSCQTESDLDHSHQDALAASQAQLDSLSREMDILRHQITTHENQIESMQQENLNLVAERNGFRARSLELAKEMKALIGPHGTLADVASRLAERNELATQLAVARAEAKRSADEMDEYKDALDVVRRRESLTDKDKDAQRTLHQNVELQRLVHQLTESLNETREQMGAVKKINATLVEKLHSGDPGFRASFMEAYPMSPFSTSSSIVDPRFSDDEDDEDDVDDENDHEDDEGGNADDDEDGAVHARR